MSRGAKAGRTPLKFVIGAGPPPSESEASLLPTENTPEPAPPAVAEIAAIVQSTPASAATPAPSTPSPVVAAIGSLVTAVASPVVNAIGSLVPGTPTVVVGGTPALIHEQELTLLHALLFKRNATADKILAQLRTPELAGPEYPGEDTRLFDLVADNLATNAQMTTTTSNDMAANSDVYYNPHESAMNWLLDHGYRVSSRINDVLRRHAKAKFKQEPFAGSPTLVELSKDELVNGTIVKMIDKVDIDIIDPAILTHLYEYSPIILEHLATRGLNLIKSYPDVAGTPKPLIWHILRVCKHNNMILETNKTSYALMFLTRLRNSPAFNPLPEFFEGCNNYAVMVALMETRSFVEAMKQPIACLGGQYLIETIDEDRVQNLLRQRGSPDPHMDIFAAAAKASETLLKPVLDRQKAAGPDAFAIRHRDEDFTLLGYSLMYGPYNEEHLRCIQIIVSQGGPAVLAPSLLPANLADKRKAFEWSPLHIAFHRFDLEAWKRSRIAHENKRNREFAERAGKPVPATPTATFESLEALPSTNGSAQLEIIKWLYLNCGSTYSKDKSGRLPVMLLPIDDRWMSVDAVTAIRQIYDEVLPFEIELAKSRLGLAINDSTFRNQLFNWRQLEHKTRQKDIEIRSKHAVASHLAATFQWIA